MEVWRSRRTYVYYECIKPCIHCFAGRKKQPGTLFFTSSPLLRRLRYLFSVSACVLLESMAQKKVPEATDDLWMEHAPLYLLGKEKFLQMSALILSFSRCFCQWAEAVHWKKISTNYCDMVMGLFDKSYERETLMPIFQFALEMGTWQPNDLSASWTTWTTHMRLDVQMRNFLPHHLTDSTPTSFWTSRGKTFIMPDDPCQPFYRWYSEIPGMFDIFMTEKASAPAVTCWTTLTT